MDELMNLAMKRRPVLAALCSLLLSGTASPAAILGPIIFAPHGVTPPAPGLVTSMTVANGSGSGSKCRYRRCLWFKKGDVPAGFVPVVKLGAATITTQFDERVTWSDGSLKLCVMSMIDSDFAGNESRTYAIYRQSGSFDNTSLRSLADVTGSHDFKVAFSSLTQNNGGGPVTRGSGSFTADFNTQSGAATRVHQYHSGPVCSSWEVWGMATDNTGGAADPHLKTVWYVTAWNNPDTTLNDVEYGAVIAQDWWGFTVSAPKYLLAYDATLKDGSTTINSYSAVSHPYQAQWMTVYTGNDNNHARRFWANAMPTLYHTFDKSYARSTGLFGYLSASFIPNSNSSQGYTSNYTPLSAQDQRADIDATGGYPGRGLMPDMDCISWMRQTPADYRYSRTNAFAGLHVGYHYRSDQNRTISSGPQAGTDTANTVISLKLRPLSSGAYDFTSQGMPAAADAYINGQSPPLDSPTYVSYAGGTGVWLLSSDSTHAVAYSYGTYMLEGERHFMQATLDLALNSSHQLHGNIFGGAPTAQYYNVAPYQTNLSIPSTQYSGVAGAYPQGGNERCIGWSANLLADAAIVCPDADVQAGFIKLYQTRHAAYETFNIGYIEPGQIAGGYFAFMTTNSQSGSFNISPWMANFNVMGFSLAAIACEDSNALSVLNSMAQNNCLAPWEFGQPYRSQGYRNIPVLYCQAQFNALTNPFLSLQNTLEQANVTISGNVLSFTNSPIINPQNGDLTYFITTDDSGNVTAIPSGAAEGTKYYAVNCSSNTCQLSATMGGSALTLGSGTFSVGRQPQGWSVTPANSAGSPTVSPDDYPGISNSALIMAYHAGASAITPTHISNAAIFVSGVDYATYSPWNMVA